MNIIKISVFFSLISFSLVIKANEPLLPYCFIGDIGEVTETQAKVAKALESSDCMDIWIPGDIIYPDGLSSSKDPQFNEKFLKPFSGVLNKNKRFFFILGNHDYKGDPESYIEIANQNDSIIFPSNYFIHKEEDICFVALDTTIYDKIYMFYKRGEQINWLKDNFNYLKENCRLSIAVGHHPLFSSGDRDKGSPQLASFLNEYVFGIFDIYIAGHNHVLADEGEKNGTLQLISGSGSLPGGSPDQAPTDKFNVETPGYLALGIENTKSGILAKYRFISAETGETLWSKIKIGKGIRY